MPKGAKFGGRKKGTPNKKTAERRKTVDAAVTAALDTLTPEQIAAMSPKDVMALTMRHYLATGELNRAHMAAVDLAPYEHPKLSAVTVGGQLDVNPSALSDAQIEARVHQLRRAGASSNGKSARAVH